MRNQATDLVRYNFSMAEIFPDAINLLYTDPLEYVTYAHG